MYRQQGTQPLGGDNKIRILQRALNSRSAGGKQNFGTQEAWSE